MKTIELFCKRLVIVFLAVFVTSCLPDTLLEPEPVEGSIVRFRITNVDGATASMVGQNINVSIPTGAPVTALVPEILVAKGTIILDYTEGQPMDFSQDVIIRVQGTDNVVVEYLVRTLVRQPQPGFEKIELLFERKHTSDYGWGLHTQYSTATSGDDVLVTPSSNIIQILDGATGELKGALPSHPGGIHQITNDDTGRIFGINSTTGKSTIRIYKWDDVNSTPERIIDYQVPQNDSDWPASGGAVGRCLLNVRGDIAGDAVITIPVVGTKFFYRWVYTEGILVSEEPEKVMYSFPLATTTATQTFGNITANVNNLGSTPADGYIVTQEGRGWEYIANGEQYTFSPEDGAIPTRAFVFDFNGATYYVGAVRVPNTSFYIFDITNPEGIEMSDSQRFEEGIDFKPFQSNVFRVEDTPNTTPHLGFSFKQHEDGTATLYYLYANSGLRAYKLTPNEN